MQRIVIIGNAGSGKSRLAESFAARLAVSATDLDQIHWSGESYGARRDEVVARKLVANVAAQDKWVIEGVYGWLAREALPRATVLIWLDLPWEACRAGLIDRGPRRGMSDDDHRALIQWASEYWTRDNSNSHAGHRRLHDAFGGGKIRLASRAENDRFADGASV